MLQLGTLDSAWITLGLSTDSSASVSESGSDFTWLGTLDLTQTIQVGALGLTWTLRMGSKLKTNSVAWDFELDLGKTAWDSGLDAVSVT